MINKDLALKLQSHLDGELSAAEAAEMARLLESDTAAVALHRELRSVKELVTTNEIVVPVPETRDFYWSKIARGIAAVEREPAPVAPVPAWAWLARWLVPIGSVAALVGLLSVAQYNGVFMTQAKRMSLLHEIESPMEDTSVVEFHDAGTGATLVWIAREPDND